MAKYYQYLKGEKQGQVVTLDFIDDSDPEIILYNFSDGNKCNESLIAPINQNNAYSTEAIMAEVENSSNIWKFKTKEIKPEEKNAIGKDGIKYEVPDPYFTTFNKGSKAAEQNHRAKVEVTAIPPKHTFYINKLDSLDKYYISYQAEDNKKEDNKKILLTNNNSNNFETLDTSVIKEKFPISNNYFIDRNNDSPQTFVFDLNYLKNVDNTLEIKDSSIDNSKKYSFDFNSVLTSLYNKEKEKEEFNNSPISIMLKNCIKKEADVNLTLTISLPSKEIYNVIKENYPDGWTTKFIEKIVNDISQEEIKKSLIISLKDFYENSFQE